MKYEEMAKIVKEGCENFAHVKYISNDGEDHAFVFLSKFYPVNRTYSFDEMVFKVDLEQYEEIDDNFLHEILKAMCRDVLLLIFKIFEAIPEIEIVSKDIRVLERFENKYSKWEVSVDE